MNGLPYYKAYPRDFIEGTIGMPFELKGAYRLLLDLIYMQGGRLPDDAKYISGLLGCSVRAWNKYRSDLIASGKIQADLGIISNFRADKELESLTSLQEKQREKASKPRKNNVLPLAAAQPKPSHTESDTDIERKKREPNGSPKDAEVDPAFERFWLAYPQKGRVGKKAALERFKRAIKSGVLEAKLISAAQAYSRSDNVQRGFAKNALTWLNQGCWDDEADSASEPQSNFWIGKALV